MTYLPSPSHQQRSLGKERFSASHAHCDESCHASDAERADRPQLLARCDIPLCELLQGRVTPESGCRIGSLPCGGGHEALEETPDAALSENDGGAVKEAAHPGIRRLAIVDASTGLMISARLAGRNKGLLTYRVVLILSKGVTASSDSVIPAPKPAITVRGPDIRPCSSCSRVLYVSKATNPVRRSQSTSQISTDRPRRTYPSFQRVPNDQCRASCVPGFSKRRPTQLLPIWQSSVELGSSLGD